MEITQDPEGDVIVGAAVSLNCTAIIPQNFLIFPVSINWTNSDLSSVENSSDGRVVVSPTLQTRPHEFLSRLTLSAVSAELDTAYNCTAQIVLEDSGEFVSTPPATKTLSIVILGESSIEEYPAIMYP